MSPFRKRIKLVIKLKKGNRVHQIGKVPVRRKKKHNPLHIGVALTHRIKKTRKGALLKERPGRVSPQIGTAHPRSGELHLTDEANHLIIGEGGVGHGKGEIPLKGDLQKDTEGEIIGGAHHEIQEVRYNVVSV